MSYAFDVEGWEDFRGNRHRGGPPSPESAHGVFVHLTNPDDRDDQHRFWAWGYFAPKRQPGETRLDHELRGWVEWWLYVAGLMHMHGMELEDEF